MVWESEKLAILVEFETAKHAVLVPDPDASMPEEWNVEDDGDWEVPLVALSTLPDPGGVAATKEDYDDFVGIERVPMVVTVTKENIQQVVNPYTGITAILFGGDDNLLSQYVTIPDALPPIVVSS